MSNDITRLDAQETAFLSQQLEYIKAKSYDTRQRNLKATQLIPVSTEVPSGSETVSYTQFTQVGIAEIVSNYANGFQRADVSGVKVSRDIHGLGSSYGYSIKEIRAAAIAQKKQGGINLSERKALAARRSIDEGLETVVWDGNADHNIPGFLNYPGVTEYTVPADGTGTSKLWSTKTPDQIVRDIASLFGAVETATSGVEHPDTLLLSNERYTKIATTRMGDGSDESILSYVMKTIPGIKTIERLTNLSTAGVGTTHRMIAYIKDPEYLTLEIPQMFEQFPAQQKGLEFEVLCYMETAGVIMYYPLSAAFGDGI